MILAAPILAKRSAVTLHGVPAGWADITARYWGGIGAATNVAYERRIGAVTIRMIRDASGWHFKYSMAGTVMSDATLLDQAPAQEARRVVTEIVRGTLDAMKAGG